MNATCFSAMEPATLSATSSTVRAGQSVKETMKGSRHWQERRGHVCLLLEDEIHT